MRNWQYVKHHGLSWIQRRKPVQQFETRLYVGRAGSGKTLFATRDAIELMRQGVVVVSNYRIWDRVTGAESHIIEDWTDFLWWSVFALREKKSVVFVIDEIHLWAPSRFYEKSPAWFLGLLAQHRHYNVGIIGTTQNLARCEIVLRELVYSIVFVKPHVLRPRLGGIEMPLYSFTGCDPLAMSGEYGQPPRHAKWKTTWVPWYVFGGYSTTELMAVNEWRDDAETTEKIEGLTNEARLLTRAERPATLAEWFGEVALDS